MRPAARGSRHLGLGHFHQRLMLRFGRRFLSLSPELTVSIVRVLAAREPRRHRELSKLELRPKLDDCIPNVVGRPQQGLLEKSLWVESDQLIDAKAHNRAWREQCRPTAKVSLTSRARHEAVPIVEAIRVRWRRPDHIRLELSQWRVRTEPLVLEAREDERAVLSAAALLEIA